MLFGQRVCSVAISRLLFARQMSWLETRMNWEDPIVNEVREIRTQIAAEHGHDLRALCKYLQDREQQETRRLVTRQPRRPDVPSVGGVQDVGTIYDADE